MSKYLFIGGSADGKLIEVADALHVMQMAARVGAVYEKEIYAKRVCHQGWQGRYKSFYFALASMSDEDAYAAFLKKQ